MTSDDIRFRHLQEVPGEFVRQADGLKLEVKGSGSVELAFDQSGRKKKWTATLGRVALVSPLGRSLLSVTSATKASDNFGDHQGEGGEDRIW